jgi:hypothetical protein
VIGFHLGVDDGRAGEPAAIELEEGVGTAVSDDGTLLVAGVTPADGAQTRPGLVLRAGGSRGAERASSRSVDARELRAPVWVALRPGGEPILFAPRRAPNGARGAVIVALPLR